MTQLEELQFRSLELKIEKQTLAFDELRIAIMNANFESTIPALCTLKIAAEKKGLKYNGLFKRHWLQPCCGKNFKKLNGVKAWPRDIILEWLYIDDSKLEEYAKKWDVDISPYFADGKTKSGR